MCRALHKLSRESMIRPVLTSHDEIIAEFSRLNLREHTAIDTLKQMMEAPANWYAGLPLAAKVTSMHRYMK
jgi:hypothetical protein